MSQITWKFHICGSAALNKPANQQFSPWLLYGLPTVKGDTRVKFSNSDNVQKLHDNSVYMGYRQPKPYIMYMGLIGNACFKGTPGVLNSLHQKKIYTCDKAKYSKTRVTRGKF